MNEREVKQRVIELFQSKEYDIYHCEGELRLSEEIGIDFLATKMNENSGEKDIIIVETKGDKPDKRYTEQLRLQKEYCHFIYLAVDARAIKHFEGGVEDQEVGLIEAYPHEAKIIQKPARNSQPSKIHLTLANIGQKKPFSVKELLEIMGKPIIDKIKLILALKAMDYPVFDKVREKITCGFYTGIATQDYSLISNEILYMLNFSYNVTSENAGGYYENFKGEYTWRKIINEYKENDGTIPSLEAERESNKHITTYSTQFHSCMKSYIQTIYSGLPPEEISLKTCDKDHFMFYFKILNNNCFQPEKSFDVLYEQLIDVKYLGEHKLPWFLINLSLDTTGIFPIRVTEKVPITNPQVSALQELGLLDKKLKGKELEEQYRLEVKEIADIIGISSKVIDIKLWWAQKDGFLGK
ncbi:MAG: hypothetical protein GF308_21290 [Candidatus Heimdallarchaeota archaeon]|nr:hypothetical protein [Candidatus Heimdallarchaeota archaeon]